MKTNLGKIFKTDLEKEKNGVWKEVYPGIDFLCARFGGVNETKRMEKLSEFYLPHLDKINDNDFPEEEKNEVFLRAFVHTSILDWRGIREINEDGVEAEEDTPFSPEEAVSILKELPEVVEMLFEFCGSRDTFKEKLGNS